MKDLITIIINVYNGEKFINKCLDSIINQTYKDLEILIINDGSNDNTLNIIKKYKDKRIRIITTENKGLSVSRNIGIDNAKGDYLYFIDSDDYIEPDTIEYLYNLNKKNNTLISTCKSIDVYDYNVNINNKKEKIDILLNQDMLIKILLWQNRTEALWNKLIKKELLNDLRFEDRIINDIAFTHKLIINTDKISYSNQIKYYHLIHNENISVRKRENLDRVEDMYKAIIERYNYIKEIYPDFKYNELGIIDGITRLYFTKSKKVKKYLRELGVIKLYKKHFSFKILKLKINYREKIRLIIFRISPGLYNFIINIYLKLKKCKRK